MMSIAANKIRIAQMENAIGVIVPNLSLVYLTQVLDLNIFWSHHDYNPSHLNLWATEKEITVSVTRNRTTQV